MLVKRRTNGQELNVEKGEDGLYEVDGVKLSADDMKAQFEIVKKPVVKKAVPKKKVASVPDSVSFGDLYVETNKSDSIGELALALSKSQAEFSGVKKESSGYSYDFADLNSVIQSSAPIFTKHGLAISQDIVSMSSGGTFYSGVETTLMHSSGEWKSTTAYAPTERSKQNPLIQMFGVNTTYIRRYQYQAILGLATTDSDGNE